MKLTYSLFLLFTLLFWSGCASRQNRPVTLYTLHSDIPLQTVTQSGFQGKTIQILQPKSTKELNKNKIWYAKNTLERNSYLYSRWSDTPNRLIARYLRSYLNRAHICKAVIGENSFARPDYIIESTLEDFYQFFETEKRAYAILKMHFFLIDTKKEKVIDTLFVNLKIPSPSPDAKGAAEAFHNALKTNAETLLEWLRTPRK